MGGPWPRSARRSLEGGRGGRWPRSARRSVEEGSRWAVDAVGSPVGRGGIAVDRGRARLSGRSPGGCGGTGRARVVPRTPPQAAPNPEREWKTKLEAAVIRVPLVLTD